jgi:hypothetical protein
MMRAHTTTSWKDIKMSHSRYKYIKAPAANYRQISGPNGHLANLTPFKGNSMFAQIEDGDYVVYSYWTEIGRVTKSGEVVVPDTRYSVTTSKHQGKVGAWMGYKARQELHS